MSNPYWSGAQKAHLTPAQISAPWGRPGKAHSLRSIAFVNRAFEIYYEALQRIGRCPDPEQARQMLASLHDAARTGWGFGVSDLEEAFEHLHDNRGRWTDKATKNYYGGPNKVFQGAIIEAPVSIVNFMNAVDARLKELRRVVDRYHQQVRDLENAQRQDDWTRIGRITWEVKRWGERAKPFLWYAPYVQTRLGQVVSFAGALGRIHTGLTMYTRAQQAGFDRDAAAGLAALRTALTWVPVLGRFYGKAVEMIPGLVTWFRGLIEDRIRRLERAAAGY